MSTALEVHLTVPNNWEFIVKASECIKTLFNLYFDDKMLISRIEVVSHELLENIVKYSNRESGMIPSIHLELSEDRETIHISTKNEVLIDSEHNEKQVQKIIDRLNQASEAIEVYAARMNEREQKPDGHSRLGLLRIAAEEACKLTASFDENSILQIEASLAVKDPFMDD